jgi:hypothetical protein
MGGLVANDGCGVEEGGSGGGGDESGPTCLDAGRTDLRRDGECTAL